jgi:dissimilatory sulfite reductase (desulfoviridin) alpha/beta subunit
MWALRGLRNGVLTTRWPDRPDDYAAATRGPAAVLSEAEAGAISAAGLTSLCPVAAISQDQPGSVRVDQGRCIQCGRCIAARPDVFGWAAGGTLRSGRVPPAAGRRLLSRQMRHRPR